MPATFQPTRPLRGATCGKAASSAAPSPISTHAPLAGRDCRCRPRGSGRCHFNPRAPCGARPGWDSGSFQERIISTHAPLAGRDARVLQILRAAHEISTHAPLAGRDLRHLMISSLLVYFNPRAPCGARPQWPSLTALTIVISTHAPLAGRDLGLTAATVGQTVFQPTRPLRGATHVLQLIRELKPFQPTRPLRGATHEPVISS